MLPTARMRFVLMLFVLVGAVPFAGAQPSIVADPRVAAPAPRDREATLSFANRPIVTLRAEVLSRMPADRAAAAVRVLDRAIARGLAGPVEARDVGAGVLITVAGDGVITLVEPDVDALSGETLAQIGSTAAARLRTALAEAAEAHAPWALLRGAGAAAAATALGVVWLWLLRLAARYIQRRLRAETARSRAPAWRSQLVEATRLPQLVESALLGALAVCAALVCYLWLAFVLRRFPYSRPWGETLRQALFAQVASFAAAVAAAAPGLAKVAIILVATRVLARGATRLFDSVAEGRASVPGVYPDTAVATRRLVVAVLWLLGAATAYPYVPGSDSSGFKGISVFVGLVLSLGSSGVVQHLMSGLMLTFSRAVHVGDFARIGDVQGTVVQIGALATKMRTAYGEEVTIPNAVVVSQTTINFSGAAGAAVPRLTTSVTIGYDTPWRQVEALLLEAAEQTPDIRATPPPVVLRTALEDFYIRHTLLVTPEEPCRRLELLDRLHARILDTFNAHGVQIMSPHYLGDPASPKLVAPTPSYAAASDSQPL